jgi:hypothetical protein
MALRWRDDYEFENPFAVGSPHHQANGLTFEAMG